MSVLVLVFLGCSSFIKFMGCSSFILFYFLSPAASEVDEAGEIWKFLGFSAY
jgi:hypothetical protein